MVEAANMNESDSEESRKGEIVYGVQRDYDERPLELPPTQTQAHNTPCLPRAQRRRPLKRRQQQQQAAFEEDSYHDEESPPEEHQSPENAFLALESLLQRAPLHPAVWQDHSSLVETHQEDSDAVKEASLVNEHEMSETKEDEAMMSKETTADTTMQEQPSSAGPPMLPLEPPNLPQPAAPQKSFRADFDALVERNRQKTASNKPTVKSAVFVREARSLLDDHTQVADLLAQNRRGRYESSSKQTSMPRKKSKVDHAVQRVPVARANNMVGSLYVFVFDAVIVLCAPATLNQASLCP